MSRQRESFIEKGQVRRRTLALLVTALLLIGAALVPSVLARGGTSRGSKAAIKAELSRVADAARLKSPEFRQQLDEVVGLGEESKRATLTRYVQSSGRAYGIRKFRKSIQPLQPDGGERKCPKSTPDAVSGFFLVATEASVQSGQSGQIQLGDSFPSTNDARTNAKSWLVDVVNVTNVAQDWIGGAVCASVPLRYRFFGSKVQPSESDGGVLMCPRNFPYAISGNFLVDSDKTGQLQLGDSFPVLRGKGSRTKPRGWTVLVKNLTDQPKKWLGGVVCTNQEVRVALWDSTVQPLTTDGGAIKCPKDAPNAVSGLFVDVTDSTVRAQDAGPLQLTDFFPSPGGTTWGVGVKNMTNQAQEWVGGALCM